MLETMIIRELIMQEAIKEGIENTPAVKEKLEELKKRLVVEAYLKKKVEEQAKVSDEELKKVLRAEQGQIQDRRPGKGEPYTGQV